MLLVCCVCFHVLLLVQVFLISAYGQKSIKNVISQCFHCWFTSQASHFFPKCLQHNWLCHLVDHFVVNFVATKAFYVSQLGRRGLQLL